MIDFNKAGGGFWLGFLDLAKGTDLVTPDTLGFPYAHGVATALRVKDQRCSPHCRCWEHISDKPPVKGMCAVDKEIFGSEAQEIEVDERAKWKERDT